MALNMKYEVGAVSKLKLCSNNRLDDSKLELLKDIAELFDNNLIIDNLKNVDSISIDVDIDNSYAKATVKVKYKGLINITNRDITSSYYANINDGKVTINKER